MIIQENISLHDKNWFRTGGPARFFATPAHTDECISALEFAHTHQLDTFFLGEGANILMSDDGFDGLVIASALKEIEIVEQTATHAHVRAGSGVTIQELIDWCLERNLLGLEEFSGIPGSMGGAVYINIHYFEHLLSSFAISGTVIDRTTFTVSTHDASWFAFGYDQSRLHDKNHYLTEITLRVRIASPQESAYAYGRRDEILRHRHHRYPKQRTCGSFFRNFHEHEYAAATTHQKLPFVAYYLDKLGFKGELCRGNARVSHKHANMIETSHGARSCDVISLARTMQEKVRQAFSLTPQPECQLIGFREYPLHRSEI